MMSQLCLYCLLLCFSAVLSASRPPFSFQLHSFNDLRTYAFLHLNVACHLTSCFQANGPSCYPKLLLLFAPHCSSKCLPLFSINSAFLRPFLLLLQIDVQWLPPSLCSLQTRVTSHDSPRLFRPEPRHNWSRKQTDLEFYCRFDNIFACAASASGPFSNHLRVFVLQRLWRSALPLRSFKGERRNF